MRAASVECPAHRLPAAALQGLQAHAPAAGLTWWQQPHCHDCVREPSRHQQGGDAQHPEVCRQGAAHQEQACGQQGPHGCPGEAPVMHGATAAWPRLLAAFAAECTMDCTVLHPSSSYPMPIVGSD